MKTPSSLFISQINSVFGKFLTARDLINNVFNNFSTMREADIFHQISTALAMMNHQPMPMKNNDACFAKKEERESFYTQLIKLRNWSIYTGMLLEKYYNEMNYLERMVWFRELMQTSDACKAAGRALFQ